MNLLDVYRTGMGKLAVVVAIHHRRGICIFNTSKYMCKWVDSLPVDFVKHDIDAMKILSLALNSKYHYLADKDRAILETVLNPTAPSEKTMEKVRISKEAIIDTISTDVKKRGKAAERFALYKVGMTVEDYVAAGGSRADVAYDVKHNFITLSE
jgi:hypothetical protein